ncbi:MAG: pyruvate formate lyase family protein [Deltaproteobacteria bacterium]
MQTNTAKNYQHQLKKPRGLSPRIAWLRDYYFNGTKRKWNNEFTCWSTGTPWDIQFNEMTYYIVPETYPLMQALRSGFRQAARNITLHPEFWDWSLPERRAWFVGETIVKCVPQEILPGELIAGARFNLQSSLCLTRKQQEEFDGLILGEKGARQKVKWFHDHGYGNAGATSGHIIPGYERALKIGWKGIYADIESCYNKLSETEKDGSRGAQLRAMMTASTMPSELAMRYANLCQELAKEENEETRKKELIIMTNNLRRVPWEPAETFWEALQALWINHMLVMSDENYPGPGISFGRMDQYLLPYWEKSLHDGMDREFGKELLKCFWVHCNTAYDAMIRNGNQGITAGFGQLITLSGLKENGEDATNDLTYAILEVIDEMSPILEPKPNVRIHRHTPDELLTKLVDMTLSSQGAPFILNFDERSMAGMLLEARMAGLEHLICKDNVYDYAGVGCLENTMVGNDRSGTVDNNLNLYKAVELALTGGKDLLSFTDPITQKTEAIKLDGMPTGDATKFSSFTEFFHAYEKQTEYIVKKCVEVQNASESIRAKFFSTPYLSCLIKGCAEKGLDVTQGGAEINFTTMEAVTYATTVDSLLAIKYLVFDHKLCSMNELISALKANWQGYEKLQAMAKNKAPKYGRDDDTADAMAKKIMDTWCAETWKHKTERTKRVSPWDVELELLGWRWVCFTSKP